jgi:hypothetical protein
MVSRRKSLKKAISENDLSENSGDLNDYFYIFFLKNSKKQSKNGAGRLFWRPGGAIAHDVAAARRKGLPYLAKFLEI